jgi:DNA recombination protein RmuC
MASDLLPVLIGILLVLVPAAAIVMALRIDRVGAQLRADIDARLTAVDARVGKLEAELGRGAATLREEAGASRAEAQEALRTLRQDLAAAATGAESLRDAIGGLAAAQAQRHAALEAMSRQATSEAAGDAGVLRERLEAAVGTIESRLGAARAEAATAVRALGEELANRLKLVADGAAQAVQQASDLQRERLEAQAQLIAVLTQGIEAQHTALRHALEARLDAIKAEGTEKLEEMQRAIDGELQTARDARLFDSVKRVSDSLDQVHKAVGEMQSIASGVDNLRALPRAFDSSR